MKYFFFAIAMLTLTLSCQKDESPAPTGNNVLHYDGDNFSGPLLAPGIHELAVRFPAADLAAHKGKRIQAVSFFAGNNPADCKVRIYGQGTATQPGSSLYQATVTNDLNTPAWNTHTIGPDLTIGDEDLWVSVQVQHPAEQQSIGCDAGPRKNDGDWLFLSTDGDWKTFEERTGQSVNWNIRLVLEE
ncbi:MAG: hypothetical protein CMN32_04805 [Saprospirales bacterium]|nr:hypothetical protein [Saprospirales bacterium]